MELAIYGAQGYALAAFRIIGSLYPKRDVVCFVVTETKHNPSALMNVPVVGLAEFAARYVEKDKDGVEILIATPENVQPEIEENLEGYGFRCHQRLDSARWAELMKLYLVREGKFLPLSAVPPGCHRAFIRTFAAQSHKDRPLCMPYPYPEWLLPLQVGAALTERKVAAYRDDCGENISRKNGNYSELTGLYWIWKNRLCAGGSGTEEERQYYGLFQYRRVLKLSEDDIGKLCDNDIDAVLPYPLPYDPDINEHHKRYIKESDWQVLVAALHELQPEYAAALPEILRQEYFFNYNVILAKKTVLQDYCEWLFPILERVEELSVPRGYQRTDRYIGYMGETLETLYFVKNKDRLNLAVVECRMLV